jgi:MoaA/NifB/PqqE/SkfB family radical SAM enzyme
MKSVQFAKLAMTALENNFIALSKPYKLTFSVTYRCQSRCLTCGIWRTKPSEELSLQEIQEFSRKNDSFRWIELTGGEPFLRSDIVDIARAFYETSKGMYIMTIPTNSLCSPDLLTDRIGRILELGIPRLSITLSLDGYRELHDMIRGVPGNFDRVMEMARRLRELQKKYSNLFFVFGYTMSKYNEGKLSKTIEEVGKIIPDLTYNNFHVNASQVSDVYYRNEVSEVRAERETMAREVAWLLKNRKFELGAIPIIETVFLKKLVDYIRTGESPMRSKSLDASLFLDSYGNVYPSIMWGRKIGNIKETGYDLAPIWRSGEAEEVRKLIREGKEPKAWTACEAYQAIVGNAVSLLGF